MALSTIAAVSKGVCRWLGPPWIWKSMQGVLDELRKHAFNTGTGQSEVHHHRVTLFKHRKFRLGLWRWWCLGQHPWSGWLVPVLRSGHITQRSKTVFLAPDRGDHAEGVAGKAYNSESIIFCDNLPKVTSTSPDPDVQQYATDCWVPKHIVKSRLEDDLTCARSYSGMAIEVRGVRWGVIVLDSQLPNGVKKPKGKDPVPYRVTAKFLGTLLEKA